MPITRASCLARHRDRRRDRNPVCERILDRRGVLNVRAELPQLLLTRSRRLDVRLRPNLGEPGAGALSDPEEVSDVEVALDLEGHLLELDPARGGVRYVADRVAEPERRQQQLDRVRPSVATEQDRRLVTDERERVPASLVLGSRVHERADLRRRARPLLPGRAGAEGEVRELRLRLDRLDRLEERPDVDAVANTCGCHFDLPWSWFRPLVRKTTAWPISLQVQ